MQDKVSYEQLIAYAAGELDATQAAQVEAYLKTHPDAARTVARYRALRSLMKSAPPDSPSSRATSRAKSIFKRRGKRNPPNGQNCTGILVPYAELVLSYPAALKFRLSCILHSFLYCLSPKEHIHWAPRLLFVLFIVSVALFARAGGAAAQDSLPGETLYPVKRTVETFRLAMTYDPDYQRDLRLDFARERLRETRLLLADERYDRVQEALVAYEMHISNATRGVIVRENATERSLARTSNLQISLVELRSELEIFAGMGPVQVAEALKRALALSNERIEALVALNHD